MRRTLVVQRVLLYYDESPRRPAVIRQLLTGHLTTSSRFWGMCYGILDIVNTDYELGFQLERISDIAAGRGWLERDGRSSYRLTPAGRRVRDEYLRLHRTMKRPELFARFSCRRLAALLSLCVQVASELSFGGHRYMPVTGDYHVLWLFRSWYLAYGMEGIGEIRTGLLDFLAGEDETDAAVFMAKFAGHETAGRTREQIADDYGLEVSDVVIIERDLTVRFGEFMLERGGRLAELFRFVTMPGIVSESALKTYGMVRGGADAVQIARQRRLKVSTVTEHLLDCSIVFDDFPFERFVSEETRRRVGETYSGERTVDWDFRKCAGEGVPFPEYRLIQIERVKRHGASY